MPASIDGLSTNGAESITATVITTIGGRRRSNDPSPLTDVSVGEILERALGIEPARWTRADQMRVVRVSKE